MRRLGALLVGLALAAPGLARANQVYSSPCDGSATPVDHFAVTDTVCVAGDVDLTCPGRLGVRIPGADVYVMLTGGGPFSVPGVHFDTLGGAGSFWDIEVLRPPLVPGVYDIFLDENCDGVHDGDDVYEIMHFTVGGDLMCSAPPGAPINPGIPSGAQCRGACGGDCPASCTPAPTLNVCEDDADLCEHVDCAYMGVTCGTHMGCRVHDDCYDACAAAGASWTCWRQCDLDCLNTYGLPCGSWARGGGPYDGTLTFYGPPAVTGPSPGLCSGSC